MVTAFFRGFLASPATKYSSMARDAKEYARTKMPSQWQLIAKPRDRDAIKVLNIHGFPIAIFKADSLCCVRNSIMKNTNNVSDDKTLECVTMEFSKASKDDPNIEIACETPVDLRVL